MVEARLNQRFDTRRVRKRARARVDWIAVAGAGLFAGSAMLMLLLFLAAAIYDESPWKIIRMMAATVRGPGALSPENEFDASLSTIGLADPPRDPTFVLPDDLDRFIARSAIDDDEFEIRPLLEHDRSNRLFDEPPKVE